MGKTVKITVAICLVLFFIGLGAIVLFLTTDKTVEVNLKDYVRIELSGVDGYATAKVVVDYEKMDFDFSEKVKTTDRADYVFSRYGEYTFAQAVEKTGFFTLSKNEKLENGSVIIVQWKEESFKYLAAYEVELLCEDFEYTVSGLQSVGNFDVFSFLEVTFEGIDGSGTVSLNITGTHGFGTEDFIVDKKSNLSNGDVVNIRINSDAIENHIAQYGSQPTEKEKQYTVSGLSEPPTEPPETTTAAPLTTVYEEIKTATYFVSAQASSTLPAYKTYTYSASNVLGNDDSCWCEYKRPGAKGEWIMLYLPEKQYLRGLKIVNGYAGSEWQYNNNAKLKTIRLEFSDGQVLRAELNVFDTSRRDTIQNIIFDEAIATQYVKIVIESVADGQYEDTCLTYVAPY